MLLINKKNLYQTSLNILFNIEFCALLMLNCIKK